MQNMPAAVAESRQADRAGTYLPLALSTVRFCPKSQNGNMMVRLFDGGPAPFIPLKSTPGISASCRGLDDACRTLWYLIAI